MRGARTGNQTYAAASPETHIDEPAIFYNDEMLPAFLQLADSALPIGAAAHSFGLETLVEQGILKPENLLEFFSEHLAEAGVLEATYVRRAWRGEDPARLSLEFSARRPARESREATLKMGARFIDLFNALTESQFPRNLHYPVAFGVAGAFLGIDEDSIATAFLQQGLTGLISACQRLLPLGQVAASRMLWNLGPAVMQAVTTSTTLEAPCFNLLPELGSMRHRLLETRLFIS